MELYLESCYRTAFFYYRQAEYPLARDTAEFAGYAAFCRSLHISYNSSMSTVAPKLMTAEEFWHSRENGKRRELVAGEVVVSIPPGGIHGIVARRLCARWGEWADAGSIGEVGTESGFIHERDPDLVRGPDVYFISRARIPASGIPEAFWNLAPDLAVEIISPDEMAVEIRGKTLEYLHAGSGAGESLANSHLPVASGIGRRLSGCGRSEAGGAGI